MGLGIMMRHDLIGALNLRSTNRFQAIDRHDMIFVMMNDGVDPPTKGMPMDDIYTVAELIEELQEMPPDARVFIAVVKYPNEFQVRPDGEGAMAWDLSDDVECLPLERDEVTLQRGMVYLTAELTDYNEARAQLTPGP